MRGRPVLWVVLVLSDAWRSAAGGALDDAAGDVAVLVAGAVSSWSVALVVVDTSSLSAALLVSCGEPEDEEDEDEVDEVDIVETLGPVRVLAAPVDVGTGTGITPGEVPG
jgi:hypothetical protein